jgi:hypothetical protein
MRTRFLAVVAGVTLATLATTLPAAGQGVYYSGSLQISSGQYDLSDRSNSLFFFNGLSASAGPLRLSASVGLVFRSSPIISYSTVGTSGMGSGMSTESGTGTVTVADTSSYEELGFGDPLAHADLLLLKEGSVFPAVRITADVKPPLADVGRGFGTGEWDYAGGLSLAKALGTTLVFVDVSYWMLGDLPDVDLNDPVAYGVGIARAVAGGRFGILASLFGYTRILDAVDPPAQVSLGLSYLLRNGRSVMGSAALGLSESSPDVSISFGWTIRL